VPNGDEPLKARIEEVLLPSTTDVRRAKHTLLASLEDGRSHRSPWLISRAAEDLGAVSNAPTGITFHEQATADSVDPNAPALVSVRSRLAAMRGLAELAALGTIISASDPAGEEESRHDPLMRNETITIGTVQPGSSGGVNARVDRPMLAEAYMLTYPSSAPWLLEPDLFAEEIGDIVLSDRAHRALREALDSFRRGLYLACASLLGVVSEAAWYAAAERLGTPPIAKAIEEDATARMQNLVAEHLRADKALARRKTLPDELLAHAALLRDIRNYGVHPRETRDDLERWFTEDACALLIRQTHHYLTLLASTVEEASS
jgi:hypothetical protein